MIPALQQAATDKELRGKRHRVTVYLYLCTVLDTNEFRPIKITALARFLCIRRSHLSEAVNYLIGAGYLDAKRDREDERRRSYRLFYSRQSVPQTGHTQAA